MRGFRITVAILGLTLGLAMFIQTTLVYSISSLWPFDEGATDAGAMGVAMALLWLLGVALVFPLPVVSVGLFVIATIVGFIASPDFPDLAIWASASLLLAGLSALAWWDQHEYFKQLEEDRQVQRSILQAHLERGGPPPMNWTGTPYGSPPGQY